MTRKTTPSAYRGQYLRTIRRPRKTGPDLVEHRFKPKPDQIPKGWLDRHPRAIRVPRDPDKRTGGETERAAAWLDAAALFEEFNRMRRAPEGGGEWPWGSLRWLAADWRRSTWFADELAPTTRDSYESCLKQIEAWADEVAARRGGLHPHVEKMTAKSLGEFLRRWDQKPTRQRHLRVTLLNLFTHAIQRDVVRANPVHDVRLARRKRGGGRKRAVVLWDSEFVGRAVAEARRIGRPEAGAWIATMWDIGRRPTDLNGLLVLDDLTRERLMRGQITEGMYYDPVNGDVRGWQSKTKKFGSIPLDAETIALIEAVRPRVEDGANQRHVFINRRTGEPFTLEQFGHLFARIARAAGLPDTTPQMGRHSCIMRFYRNGATDGQVRTVTDHSDPAMVRKKYWIEDDSQAAAAKAARAQSENRG